MYMRASELRKFSRILHSKTAIYFFQYFFGTSDTLSVQNDMLVGLHRATNFEMYRQNSEKALLGGGGNCPLPPPPPPPPPPPRYANGWQCKEADIWFGRESVRVKDLVCLVVFLCWIKRFVLLSLCLKCKYMNRYFSSFQKSRGGRSPQKNSRGGDTPPPPPPVPPGIAAYAWSHCFDAKLRVFPLWLSLMSVDTCLFIMIACAR